MALTCSFRKKSLVLFHLALHAPTDFLVNVQDVDFTIKLLEQILKASLHIGESSTTCLFSASEADGPQWCQPTGPDHRCWRSTSKSRVGSFVQFDVLVKLLHHGSTQSLNFTRLGFVSGRATGVTVALKWVSASLMEETRARCWPSTSTLTVPSGSLSICKMVGNSRHQTYRTPKARLWRRPSGRPT